MMELTKYRPKSQLRLPETRLSRPKMPVIDAHNHLSWYHGSVEELIGRMDAFGIAHIVSLDGEYGTFDAHMQRYVAAYPDRFSVLCQVDMGQIDDPDFGRNMAKYIDECVQKGARGLKFHKTMLGLSAKDASGAYVMPDDDRLKPVWEAAAKNDVPALIHIADPLAFFEPIDETNERAFELGEHPDWSYYNVGTPGFDELMEAQDRLLSANPDTTFVIAHVGSQAENLAAVGALLDAHPNVYTDTAERIAELGRQPYTAREFLIKYADRVLYGTDLIPNAHNTSYNYRFFETRDEYFPYNSWDEHNQGCWNIYGVFLPDDVLQKIYVDNAAKVFGIPR